MIFDKRIANNVSPLAKWHSSGAGWPFDKHGNQTKWLGRGCRTISLHRKTMLMLIISVTDECNTCTRYDSNWLAKCWFVVIVEILGERLEEWNKMRKIYVHRWWNAVFFDGTRVSRETQNVENNLRRFYVQLCASVFWDLLYLLKLM